MHVIPPAPRACILLRDGHPPVEFPSREAAFAAIRPQILAGRLGPAFAPPVYRTSWVGTTQAREAITHVLLDVLTGRPLSAQDFADWLPERKPWIPSRYASWSGAGPVPGTGRRRHRFGAVLRYPKTQASRRAACQADPDDLPPRPRAGRNLPTSWDDSVRSDCGDRCWKRHRMTRWR
jgi:hypothetical protein